MRCSPTAQTSFPFAAMALKLLPTGTVAGTGTIDHADPFQRMTSGLLARLPGAVALTPAAQTLSGAAAETSKRRSLAGAVSTSGVGTVVQLRPSKCWATVRNSSAPPTVPHA